MPPAGLIDWARSAADPLGGGVEAGFGAWESPAARDVTSTPTDSSTRPWSPTRSTRAPSRCRLGPDPAGSRRPSLAQTDDGLRIASLHALSQRITWGCDPSPEALRRITTSRLQEALGPKTGRHQRRCVVSEVGAGEIIGLGMLRLDRSPLSDARRTARSPCCGTSRASARRC